MSKILSAPIIWIIIFVALGGIGLGLQHKAAHEATAACNAQWQAKLNEQHIKALQESEAQMRRAMELAESVRQQSEKLKAEMADLEAENERIKNGDACGLDNGRVRLLNRQAHN